MRRRYVMRRGEAGEWRLVELELAAPPKSSPGPAVWSDFAPYRSMRTGETISGRAQHRDHLARHGLIEVGNELQPFVERRPVPLDSIGPDIRRELARDPGERRALAEQVLNEAGYDAPAVERILKPSQS